MIGVLCEGFEYSFGVLVLLCAAGIRVMHPCRRPSRLNLCAVTKGAPSLPITAAKLARSTATVAGLFYIDWLFYLHRTGSRAVAADSLWLR